MMQNENIVENNQIPDTADSIFDSPSSNEIVGESTELTETEQTEELIEENIVEQIIGDDVATVTETEESEYSEQPQVNIEYKDYTETLVAIDEHVQLMSARVEYCSCLLIIILLIILLQYVYKFFKMFF